MQQNEKMLHSLFDASEKTGLEYIHLLSGETPDSSTKNIFGADFQSGEMQYSLGCRSWR